jgi:hypothetical protein
MIALTEDRQAWPVVFVIPRSFLIAAPQRLGNAGIELGTVPSSLRRTSANDRSDEILMCYDCNRLYMMKACLVASVM